MAQKILSITLGTTSAKIAEIVKTGKKIQVYSACDIPISEGLLDDGNTPLFVSIAAYP